MRCRYCCIAMLHSIRRRAISILHIPIIIRNRRRQGNLAVHSDFVLGIVQAGGQDLRHLSPISAKECIHRRRGLGQTRCLGSLLCGIGGLLSGRSDCFFIFCVGRYGCRCIIRLIKSLLGGLLGRRCFVDLFLWLFFVLIFVILASRTRSIRSIIVVAIVVCLLFRSGNHLLALKFIEAGFRDLLRL